MELVTRVALDTFGLLIGLAVVALHVIWPFMVLPLEVPLLLIVVFPI